MASSSIPFLDLKPYFRKENQHEVKDVDDDAVEAVTNESTVGGNYFRYPFPHKVYDIKERFKRNHVIYKDVMYRNLKQGKQVPPTFYKINSRLFRPDVNVDDFDQIMFEHSFTFVGLAQFDMLNRLIKLGKTDPENLRSGIFSNMTKKMIEELTLQIDSKQNCVFHHTHTSAEVTQFLVDLLKKDREDDEVFPAPFIQNVQKLSPLHLTFNENNVDSNTAECYLTELLPNMPLDHHGRAISSTLYKCIEHQIPGVGDYIDSRFINTKHLFKMGRQKGYKLTKDYDGEASNGVVSTTDLWPVPTSQRGKLFEKSKGTDA